MNNKIFIKSKINNKKSNPGKDIEKLQSMFTLNNYQYKNINKKEEESAITYRWPLLKSFNHIAQRG